ncbi:HRDC domain-containing protein [Parasporobacterium paucivorans]|uniref:HRDC domain-containing protein n=1 Tax=Parasporobacterium paucivorans DSM 15970 TaxID=1122934 RepID=A0A1M6K1G8_9FIRM|nr:HRDC domain-containing protein [Parasporobacterium paucivorans]SHJ52692.1 HRDC domain-containing protein [Parasporobacterium paucivorans DSM 15970]
MGLFDRLKEPVLLKESGDSQAQLEALKDLHLQAPDSVKPQIEQDIRFLTYGIRGEETIAFELKNSHIPMYVLHDLHYEWEGLTAQIDYLLITRKRFFVIECKNLFGSIEINNSGDFIRTTEFKGRYRKEGIYSPITQNKRHLELLKQIRRESKGNILTKTLFDKNFYDTYRAVVVLANPKTVLNARFASKEVKNQVIRADQLIEYIKKVNNQPGTEAMSDKFMEELARFYLDAHSPNPVNYLKKYEKMESAAPEKGSTSHPGNAGDSDLESELWDELKAFRLKRSREENIKPYCIFSDNQMRELIGAMPKTVEDLRAVSGFGDVKCSKYGDEIVEIMTAALGKADRCRFSWDVK